MIFYYVCIYHFKVKKNTFLHIHRDVDKETKDFYYKKFLIMNLIYLMYNNNNNNNNPFLGNVAKD